MHSSRRCPWQICGKHEHKPKGGGADGHEGPHRTGVGLEGVRKVVGRGLEGVLFRGGTRAQLKVSLTRNMDMNGHPLAQDPWSRKQKGELRLIFVHKFVPSSLSWFQFIFQICKLLCYLILMCNPLGIILLLGSVAYNSQSLTLGHTNLRLLQQQHLTSTSPI